MIIKTEPFGIVPFAKLIRIDLALWDLSAFKGLVAWPVRVIPGHASSAFGDASAAFIN